MKKSTTVEHELAQQHEEHSTLNNSSLTDYEEYFKKTVKEFDDFLEIPVHVNIVLGKKMVRIAELLDLAPGSILDLKRPAGENLLIFLEDTLFGKGEVTVKEDSFTIRLTGINDPRNV